MKNEKGSLTMTKICIPFFIVIIFNSIIFSGNIDTNKSEIENIPIIRLSGKPYDIGYQHGQSMKQTIQLLVQDYLYKKVLKEWVKAYSLLQKGGELGIIKPGEYLLQRSKVMEKEIPQELIEEMKGIADGAEVPYEDVLMSSTHVDFLAILQCSGFAAWDNLSSDGKLITGRNLDWGHGELGEITKYPLIIFTKPEKGFPFVSMSFPGMVGVLTGMNSKGITVELNFSMSKDNSWNGKPIMVLMREVLQYSSTIEEAVERIINAPRMGGYNILITDGKAKKAKVIEISATKYGIRGREKGRNGEAEKEGRGEQQNWIATTNHFMTEQLLGTNMMDTSSDYSNSDARYDRLKELITQNTGKVDVNLTREFMHDKKVRQKSTIQSIIMVPEDLKFWFWYPARNWGDFVEINVGDW